MTEIPLKSWVPFVPPFFYSLSDDGRDITFPTTPKTDWWRTGSVHSTSGAFVGFKAATWGKETKLSFGVHDLRLGAEEGADGEHAAPSKFDQVGIMLWISDTCWIKAGLEFEDGKVNVSCVVCDAWADWSLYPTLETSSSHALSITITPQESEPFPLIKLIHNGAVLRELPAFGMSSLPAGEAKSIRVGVMGCSPLSEGLVVSAKGFFLNKE